jgi:hypothetical protein
VVVGVRYRRAQFQKGSVANMADLLFQGELFNDDRMFVLHIARCTSRGRYGITSTQVHHEVIPQDARWCLVTYRNTLEYPPVRVDHFNSLEGARAYLERVEPIVPLISLGGRAPDNPLTYEAWVAWKAANHLKEYDYRTRLMPGGENPVENIYMRTPTPTTDGSRQPGESLGDAQMRCFEVLVLDHAVDRLTYWIPQ